MAGVQLMEEVGCLRSGSSGEVVERGEGEHRGVWRRALPGPGGPGAVGGRVGGNDLGEGNVGMGGGLEWKLRSGAERGWGGEGRGARHGARHGGEDPDFDRTGVAMEEPITMDPGKARRGRGRADDGDDGRMILGGGMGRVAVGWTAMEAECRVVLGENRERGWLVAN